MTGNITASEASLAFRVCLFFACNPDEELSSSDAAAKFDTDLDNVRKKLQNAVEQEWLAMVKDETPRWGMAQNIYRPGPKLLATIGRTA